MKKIKLFFTFLFLLGITMTVNSQGITNTAHDFAGDTWNSSGEICIVCHTPHNALSSPDSPLWNHEITTATFTLYSSTTLDATLGQPNGGSKLCLSCHDGTVAVENFGGVTDGTNIIGGSNLVGTDLLNDHPISFTYDGTLATADGGLHDPSVITSGLGSTINDDLLFGSQMQCSSCHDVHNAAGWDFLLVKSNAGSALCLTCHNK